MTIVPKIVDKKANKLLLLGRFKVKVDAKKHKPPLAIAKTIAEMKFIIRQGVCPGCGKPLAAHEWPWTERESYKISYCNNCKKRTKIKRIMV